jgi:hypothetical protein
MRKTFLRLVIIMALLQFALQCAVTGIIFVTAHIPPKAFNLDGLILVLLPVHQILRSPRAFFEWIWPGEHTPWLLTWPLLPINSLVWGSALAGLKVVIKR